MTEAELAELERLIAYKRQQGLTELRLTLDDADKLLSLARRAAKLEGALQDLLNAIQWWREGGITAEGCQQAEAKARAALAAGIVSQPQENRDV